MQRLAGCGERLVITSAKVPSRFRHGGMSRIRLFIQPKAPLTQTRFISIVFLYWQNDVQSAAVYNASNPIFQQDYRETMRWNRPIAEGFMKLLAKRRN
jgi:hypothetical protein